MAVSREEPPQGQPGALRPNREALKKLVVELEEGKLPLEKSLETFAEGVKLAREAGRKLDDAERRVELLLRAEDGTVALRPLDAEEEGGCD